jgi:hypothetical protein
MGKLFVRHTMSTDIDLRDPLNGHSPQAHADQALPIDAPSPKAPAIDTPPPSSGPRSHPPPLPQNVAPASHPQRVAADAAFAERMLERLAASDYAGALLAAEALLETHPGHQDLLDTAQIARSELRKLYVSRLGSLERKPRLGMGPQALFSLQGLDFRAGLLLSRVDGRVTLQEIADASGMQPQEALRVLSELYLRRAIVFDD